MARPYEVLITIVDRETDHQRARHWRVPDGVVIDNTRLAVVATWAIAAIAELDAETDMEDL